jgi:Holliday junction DNA helicase RuvA
MIARLHGRPVARRGDAVVLDVGGVGYLVIATAGVVRAADTDADLVVETYLHVREDALQLYGFATVEERELFELLLSVQGVGPKVALAILSGSSPAELRRAVARQDTARFEAIPGIGRKTAQRVVLELGEKLTAPGPAVETGSGVPPAHVTARDALVSLGYTVLDAERALAEVDSELQPEELVREVLRRAA